MRDPRIDKLARTLVRFSTQVRDGDNVLIQATDADRELVKALIEEVYRAGGKPFVWLRDAQIERALLLGCTAEQLELRARADAMLMERMQVYIGFTGILNRAEHSDVPAEKQNLFSTRYTHSRTRRGARAKDALGGAARRDARHGANGGDVHRGVRGFLL